MGGKRTKRRHFPGSAFVKFPPIFVKFSEFQELLDVGRQLAIHGTRLLLLTKVQIIRRVEMCWTLLLTLFLLSSDIGEVYPICQKM